MNEITGGLHLNYDPLRVWEYHTFVEDVTHVSRICSLNVKKDLDSHEVNIHPCGDLSRLKWTTIEEMAHHYGAQIYCFQGVHPSAVNKIMTLPVFNRHFEHFFTAQSSTEGILTLYHKDFYRKIGDCSLKMNESGTVNFTHFGHILVLRNKSLRKNVQIANISMKSDTPFEKKLDQICHIMFESHLFATGKNAPSAMFAGSFSFEPTSIFHQLLTRGYIFKETWSNNDVLTAEELSCTMKCVQGCEAPCDHLKDVFALPCHPLKEMKSMYLDHYSRLTELTLGIPKITDYIFSKEAGMKLVSFLRLPVFQDHMLLGGPWCISQPSPSDHVPIVLDFLLE